MKYCSKKDTKKHIRVVRKNIRKIIFDLLSCAYKHDRSKLHEPELSTFNEYTPKLKTSTYGSDEYKQFLKGMSAALDNHYKKNRHHPEHFEDGIKGMNLVDIIEMFCDWYAATKRHDDGDIFKSISINQKRFNYSDDLKSIFENTAKHIFKEKNE